MVTDLAEFKAAKEAKAKPPLVSRRRANLAAGTLLTALEDSEQTDILCAMRFDLTPDDMTAIECFTFHLQQRIEDRKNGYQRRKRIPDQPGT